MEDEKQLVLVECRSSATEKQKLFSKIVNLFLQFQQMDNTD